jgi:phosphate transport system permease protein
MHEADAHHPLPSSPDSAPQRSVSLGERLMGPMLRASVMLPVILLVALVAALIGGARAGVEGVATSVWPAVSGTLVVTGLAAMLAVPVGLAAATFLVELASPGQRRWLEPAFELLAGLPAIVHAWLAVAVLGPALAAVAPGLALPDIVGAVLVLALMIVPTTAALAADALRAVPGELRSAALALGATHARMLWVVVMPAAMSGLASAAVVAVSRAVGETLLVTLAVGHIPQIGLDPRVAVAPLVAADRSDASIGVPALLCVVTLLSAWAIHLRGRARRGHGRDRGR